MDFGCQLTNSKKKPNLRCTRRDIDGDRGESQDLPLFQMKPVEQLEPEGVLLLETCHTRHVNPHVRTKEEKGR